MKKVIELALKSGEVILQGVINLVECLNTYDQERAVMLLTENNDIPDEVKMLDKGIGLDSKGNITHTYQCVGYNYLKDNVIVRKQTIGKSDDDIYHIGVVAGKNIEKTISSNNKKSVKNTSENNKNNNSMKSEDFWCIFISISLSIGIIMILL